MQLRLSRVRIANLSLKELLKRKPRGPTRIKNHSWNLNVISLQDKCRMLASLMILSMIHALPEFQTDCITDRTAACCVVFRLSATSSRSKNGSAAGQAKQPIVAPGNRQNPRPR